MSVRPKLMDRWFPDLNKLEEDERNEFLRRAESKRELVTREAYKTEIRDWIDQQIEELSPKPDTEQSMLYQIGKLDGLKFVRDRLLSIEHEARRANEQV